MPADTFFSPIKTAATNTLSATRQEHVVFTKSTTLPEDISSFNNTTSFPDNAIPHGSSQGSNAPHPIYWVVAFGAVLVCFLTSCYRPRIPEGALRAGDIRRRLRERAERSEKDPERRQRLIDRALITKKVTHCDQGGKLALGDVDTDDNNDKSEQAPSVASLEDGATEDSACMVCLEPFRVGDVVAWGRQMQCLHVFHHECILEWLVTPKHDDCPSCRCELVNPDEESVSGDVEEGEEGAPQTTSLAFVIINGLIARARRYSFIGNSTKSVPDSVVGIPSPVSIRRTRSVGPGILRSNSFLRVALRRVSSGIYTQLSLDEGERQEQNRRVSLGTAESNSSSLSPVPVRRVVSLDPSLESPRRRFSYPGPHAAGRSQSEGSNVIFRRASSPRAHFPGVFENADSYQDDCYSEDEDDLSPMATLNCISSDSTSFDGVRLSSGGCETIDEVDIESGFSKNA